MCLVNLTYLWKKSVSTVCFYVCTITLEGVSEFVRIEYIVITFLCLPQLLQASCILYEAVEVSNFVPTLYLNQLCCDKKLHQIFTPFLVLPPKESVIFQIFEYFTTHHISSEIWEVSVHSNT